MANRAVSRSGTESADSAATQCVWLVLLAETPLQGDKRHANTRHRSASRAGRREGERSSLLDGESGAWLKPTTVSPQRFNDRVANGRRSNRSFFNHSHRRARRDLSLPAAARRGGRRVRHDDGRPPGRRARSSRRTSAREIYNSIVQPEKATPACWSTSAAASFAPASSRSHRKRPLRDPPDATSRCWATSAGTDRAALPAQGVDAASTTVWSHSVLDRRTF